MHEADIFKIGGRYRNRLGWYEVIGISENNVEIQYENDNELHE